ncbi:unnamed protein product [Schistosoma margrebowiei]|uniref:Uncharacterized protein n=1 Tax=Schistosoma margrebowiei TaxID=48269 RepID=A0A183LNY8_9TREM|nr:unnamed protein product [Schistosoma margrebowiei]
MEDVRARRKADIASDHHLVSAENRPKLQNQWITGETTLLSCISVFLQDTDKLNEFIMALNNRFQALQFLLTEVKITMKNDCERIEHAQTSTIREMLYVRSTCIKDGSPWKCCGGSEK